MIQAIFFDFNGIIIDDEPLQLKAYQEAFRPEGVTLAENDYYDMLGMDDQTFVRALYQRAAREASEEKMSAVIERKSALHRKLIEDDLPLFPGVVTLVKHLSRQYQLGLVSMARRVEIEHVLGRAHLTDAFMVVISSEDARACKPDPHCYQRALELLNDVRRTARLLPLLPEECLVIEDAPPGIRSGRAAGMRTMGVTHTVSEKALREADADIVTAYLPDWNADAVHHVFDM